MESKLKPPFKSGIPKCTSGQTTRATSSQQGGTRHKSKAAVSSSMRGTTASIKKESTIPDVALADHLHEWAVKEMGMQAKGQYFGKKPPMPQDLGHICQGKGAEIWEHVLMHVRSESTVKKIKRTIKQSEISKGKRTNAGEENPPHLQNVMKAEKELLAAQESVHKMKNRIRRTEEKISIEHVHILELKQAIAVLKDYSKKVEKHLQKLEDFGRTLEGNLAKIPNLKLCQANASPSQQVDQEMKAALLRATIQTACDLSEKLCWHAAQVNPDETEKENIRQKFWDVIQPALETNSASTIMDAFKQISEKDLDNIRKLSHDVDLRTKFQQLLQNEEPEVKASATPSSPRTFEEIIEVLKIEHVQVASEALKLKDQVIKKKQKVKQLVDIVEGHLDVLFPDLHKKELFRSMILTSATRAQKEEYVASLRLLVKELKEENQQLLAKHTAVEVIKQKIESNEAEHKRCQVLVNSFLYKNTMLPNLLLRKQEKIQQLVKVQLCEGQLEMKNRLASMENWVTEEVQLLRGLNVSQLWNIAIGSSERLPLKQLLIYQFNHIFEEGFETLMKNLQFGSQMGGEALLLHVVNLKQQIEQKRKALQHHKAWAKLVSHQEGPLSTENVNNVILHIQDICKELMGNVQKLERCEHTIDNLSVIQHINKAVENWWSRPAQYINVGVMVNGYLFTQWMQGWMKQYKMSQAKSHKTM